MLFKKKDKNDNKDLAKVAALLIHAAKIDENFENEEKNIITQALLKLGAKIQDIEDIIHHGRHGLLKFLVSHFFCQMC